MADTSTGQGAHRPRGSRGSGLWMIVAAWLALFGGAWAWFHDWNALQVNPNRAAVLPATGDEVTLQRNRSGHYVADGAINGSPVTFMLDTGATQVALSLVTANRLGLPLGEAIRLRTANGEVVGYRTRLASVRVGPIEIADVAAVATAGMDSDFILLGMSFLKRVEFAQRADQLTLRATGR